MASYIPYPTRPEIPNGWQIAGDALYKGGAVLNEQSEREQKLRMAMEEMKIKRAAALYAKQQAEDAKAAAENKRKADEFDLKQKKDEADRALKFRKFAQEGGEPISSSYTPDMAVTPKAPPRSIASEIRELENVDGMRLPNQDVQGDPSWEMLNSATDRHLQEQRGPTKGRTVNEILNYGLETGNIDDAKKYSDAMKEKPADPFNDPNLLADYRIRAQDPSFQQIAEGYAQNPAKYGPVLQNWALQNGYAGQRWWATELGKMYHAAPPVPKPPTAPKFNPQTANSQKFSQENTLRDEYTQGTKKFSEGIVAFGKAQQALQRNNPADAYSAVINFVRTLDPASTVREAEERLARMSASGGILERFYQSVRSGVTGGLTDDVRRNLYEASKGLIQQEYEAGYKLTRDNVRAQTLNYADPTGKQGSLDTLNTIGKGRDAQYKQMMDVNIFDPKEVAPAAKPATFIPGNGKRKAITQDIVNRYYAEHGGDKAKAKRAMARDGYNIGGTAQ